MKIHRGSLRAERCVFCHYPHTETTEGTANFLIKVERIQFPEAETSGSKIGHLLTASEGGGARMREDLHPQPTYVYTFLAGPRGTGVTHFFHSLRESLVLGLVQIRRDLLKR